MKSCVLLLVALVAPLAAGGAAAGPARLDLRLAQPIVDAIREFKPDLEVKFVDSPIMNQLSYEVSRERFLATGFEFDGNLHSEVGQTLKLLESVGGA